MVVLFNLTKNMDPVYSFCIASASLLFFGIIIISLVIEHRSSKLTISQQESHDTASFDQQNNWWTTETGEITARMIEVVKGDIGFIVAFFGAFQIRMIQIIMVICMLLWVTSFVDSGYLESEEEAKTLYQKLFVVAVLGTCALVPLIIKMSDNWHLGWCIGLAFLTRSVIFILGFQMLKAPDSWWTYIATLGMLSTTGI